MVHEAVYQTPTITSLSSSLSHSLSHSLSLSLDFQSRVRQVQIRDPPQDLPKATVDDIRASVQTLQLGAQHNPSTRIRKATSSQSLNSECLSVHVCDRVLAREELRHTQMHVHVHEGYKHMYMYNNRGWGYGTNSKAGGLLPAITLARTLIYTQVY